MIRTVNRGLVFMAGVGVILSSWAMLPSFLDLPLYFLVAGIFTLPGWSLAKWISGNGADRLTQGILALPTGYVASAIACAALRLVGISSPFAVLAASAGLAALLTFAFRRPQSGVIDLVRLDARDRVALTVLWLLALGVVGPVFALVGNTTPLGLAYRAYFNADLFVHMTVVAEFAKGTVPLANPFSPLEALPYYWTYFTLPGVFSQLRPTLPVDPAIMLTDTAMALVFISVGFLAVRNFGASALAGAISWAIILLASSFEGAYFLWDQIATGKPIAEFRTWNIDAVTRWVWNLPGVDGFQRAMWWTPQHLMALTLVFILLLVVARARGANTVAPSILEGLLLGAMLAISSFNGTLLVGSYAVAQVVILAAKRGRGFGTWLASRSIAAILVVLFLSLTLGLGMVQSTPNAFLIGWNRFFLRGPWTFVLLSFGPALFLAPLGVRAAFRASSRLVMTLASILVVITVVFLFVDLRGHENTQVIFRTGHLMYLCLGILLAFAIDSWRAAGGWRSVALSTALLLGAAVALPTVALDWYNARDISNIENSPGNFPWTVHISPDDDAAAQYIHAVLPATATVQTDALPRGRNTWAFVTAFARRRMAVGNGLFTLNPTRYQPAMARVHEAYQSPSAQAAHTAFVDLGVDYFYVGDVERKVNGASVQKFALHPSLFQPVYWRGSVEVFKVVK
ncbi:MAG: hypothetical protein EXQ49_10495 [Acidobacteria bacterium]|nr:hypothetical protein [Acidobacteriota bacterium]